MTNEEYNQLEKTIEVLTRAEDLREPARLVAMHNAALKIEDMRERLKDAEELNNSQKQEIHELYEKMGQLEADLEN